MKPRHRQPQRSTRPSPLLRTLHQRQRHMNKIEQLLLPLHAWLNEVISAHTSPVNARGEYLMPIDQSHLPAWQAFESILDLIDLCAVYDIPTIDPARITQMRQYTLNGLPISPDFARSVNADLHRLAAQLRAAAPERLQKAADATLTRIYLQHAAEKQTAQQ